jgi:glycerophosphoryl diester phosphodiesterase
MVQGLGMKISVLMCGVLGLLLAGPLFAEAVRPLPQAHSHNDYEQKRPLLEALDHGFCSVEADVYLVEGQLWVAHDRKDLKPDRTLKSLYLEPLAERVRNRVGIFADPKARLMLLVDVKGQGAEVYQRLKTELAPYAPMLTRFRDTGVVTGAVTVVLSGDRAWDLAREDLDRWCALDGRMSDLTNAAPAGVAGSSTPPASLVPLVSESWRTLFRWNGDGEMSAVEKARLKGLVSQAHAQGRKIRFWALPDRPEAWKVCQDAGVDLINTDKIPGLSAFLRGLPLPPGKPPIADEN